ncbi:MAG: methylmalonyl Co-A mutase-associated GTPase MeaB [Armatimonadota bacterium]|nr:methylmalonyl Co-A mutase-associated GTPase MeaB [Armatimonadota bacterium]MDR7455407.1 methylmalonyl Co-A mutase-associated GTPase MeaB [Armatimonadota bacterium]MDR7456453.1 methylmalonyl Co-A mutase-associated GTPase MeaB [Armatimonadota bacterium]MDR7496869.1 methylmalonyl Co-A mutase-associated GTPase MeaB [Armatimonadota bacterium]MDR7512642.1 methylmalonyl Co-A mutase-associated GTPase MeaB [Armatimonadota bacterium]
MAVLVRDLVASLVAGSTQAAARLISLLENDDPRAAEILVALFPHTGRAHVVGVTGPPGSGKSSLVNAAIRRLRAEGRRVAVVAVDPTSPFTGGALLGDRVRMQDHSTDPEVFVRSMATRGSLGGLAPATDEAVAVLDAWGAEVVFIETVGTGQAEVDVVAAADTVVVVTTPGLGDGVQTIKAGVMEIGDVFVVNKADRADADRTVTDLKMALGLAARDGWRAPVLTTVATEGRGLEELLAAIADHRRAQQAAGAVEARRRQRWRRDIVRAAEARLRAAFLDGATASRLDELVAKVARGELDPRTAAARLLDAAGAPAVGAGIAGATLDHIGVAVRDLAAAAAVYERALGLAAGAPETLPADRVLVAFVPVGATRIELLEPTDADGPVARFLARRGEGVHHVAVAVPDLEAALAQARKAGCAPIDEVPRQGAHGRRIAFLHPRHTHGVLIELVERPQRAPA